MLEPMLRDTINPTIIEGGLQENAVPSEVEVLLDCRLLPGSNQSDIVHEVLAVVGENAEIQGRALRRRPANSGHGVDALPVEPLGKRRSGIQSDTVHGRREAPMPNGSTSSGSILTASLRCAFRRT